MALDFALKSAAIGWDENTDRHLHEGISYKGWETLFFKVLGCPGADSYIQGEDVRAFEERYRTRFLKSIPDYPLLGRITDYYADVWYEPHEIIRLRAECERVRSLTTEREAVTDLEKLIRACDEAAQSGLGLFLVAD